MMIEPSLLRLLWTVIEDMPSHDLLTLTDTALVAIVLKEVSRRVLLTAEEVCCLYAYIGSKILLIRDIADYRCSIGLSLAESYPNSRTPASLLYKRLSTGTI